MDIPLLVLVVVGGSICYWGGIWLIVALHKWVDEVADRLEKD